MSHSLRKQVQLTRMNRGLLQGVFEIIFVSVAPKAEKCRPPTSFQRKLLRKQFTRGKKETRQLNLMFPIILITYFFQIHNWRTWKHYKRLQRARTTSTFINIFNNTFSYIYIKKRKSVLEEKCWHLASCKSPVSKRTITRIGSENLENNAYHGSRFCL